MWGALSDERTGLSFTIASGPCQCSHFQVRVFWDSSLYVTASDSRLPFSSPLTTHRAMVEVVKPTSTWGWLVSSDLLQSQSHIAIDGQSNSKPWCWAPDIFITLWQLLSCFCGVPSLTRGQVCLLYMLLALASIVCLGFESLGTCDHILLRFETSFLSPSMTCRVTVEVPPHGWVQWCTSESESHCVWWSVNLSVLVSKPVWGSWPDISYSLTVTVMSFGGRPLWWEDGSVVYKSQSAVICRLSLCTAILHFTGLTWY
jgi:hypothetical protein